MEPLASNSDEVKADDDNICTEGTASFDESSSKCKKGRSNSVIDSVGTGGECSFVSLGGSTTSRSKSLSADTSSNGDRYSITPDSAGKICPPESVKQISDITDAHVRVVASDDDDNLIIQRPSTPIAYMPVSKEAECYNMNHKNRGKCVIFNHEEFELDFDKRDGSTMDADRLSKSFGKLGFDVEVHLNFTHTEVIETIDKLSKIDHTDNDCICIIVLTHGLKGDLLCAKDVAYKSDKIWKPFTADRCTTLAGKPKLFFFQACRGEGLDDGVVLSPRSTTSTDSVTSYKIPTHADFLIAHSSAQNFYTWRNPTEGTWYIQCLCDVLDEYGTNVDLLSLLTITARKVATDYASRDPVNITKNNKKQAPSTTSLLLRSVYFAPKSNV